MIRFMPPTDADADARTQAVISLSLFHEGRQFLDAAFKARNSALALSIAS